MKFSSVMVILYLLWPIEGQRLVPPRSYHSDDDDDDEVRHALDHDDEEDGNNSTDKGLYVGAPCEIVCNSKLLHVYCNPITGVCECEKNYPVKLNPYTGCGKPKRLGEQCYYRETCQYTDVHSACVQVHHNAICQCQDGYHSVSIQKPSKRVFCAEDLEVMTTDFSTFAGVLSGIAILSGLICFVLHLFNQNMYGPRRHRFGNANLAPPILFSSDPGSLPMPIIDRSLTSRTSSHRTLASLPSRRASSAQGCRGIAVSASRAGAARNAAILLLSSYQSDPYQPPLYEYKFGSRRPSLTSIHSGNSIKSYSQRRYERERELKEEREMQRRLARMSSSANSSGKIAPTPSPHSTDDLLPTLEEDKQESSWIAIVSPEFAFEQSITGCFSALFHSLIITGCCNFVFSASFCTVIVRF
ncbi:uncharacterized protein LOC657763 isoform X4 [Tribolium castaneum]|uniref:uncharacterized protein LOC657763 isoform X4 n=1 Tax=Tribolium castaneum TaxID=7070 RepID=UPI00077DDA7D|nr:PREDICTED: uncharacterized protein LOC657763 isoform X4 [Tribolium castaneum]|eukprot:XP_015839598.1 PREDICTED: uncharacterized protein LOC657763 isoform X4 [Tribolium castaneum]